MNRSKIPWSAACAFALLALGGCRNTTTMTGWKLGPDGSFPPGASGLPFQMSRPVFVITEVEPSAANGWSTHTVSVKHVPDPHQRYAIKILPSTLSTVNFRAELDSLGRLTKTTSGSTQQVTATVKSLGGFVAQAVTSGILDAGGADPNLAHLASPTVPTASGSVVNEEREDLGRIFASYLLKLDPANVYDRVTDAPRPATLLEVAELRDLDPALETGSDRNFVLTFPPSLEARVWLETIDKRRETQASNLASAWSTAQDTMKTGLNVGGTNEGDQLAAAVLPILANKKLSLKASRKRLADVEEEWLKKYEGDATKQALVKAFLAEAEDVLVGGIFDTRTKKLVSDFLSTKVNVWKARYLAELEERHGMLTRRVLLGDDVQAELDRVQEQIHELLGVSHLVTRRGVLRQFLEEVKDRTVTVNGAVQEGPATEEYTQVRTELDALNARIAEVRTKLIAAGTSAPTTPTTKPKPKKDRIPPVVVGLKDYVEHGMADDRAKQLANADSTARWVVILEEAYPSEPTTSPAGDSK